MTASCFGCSFRQSCFVGKLDDKGVKEFSKAAHRYTVRGKGRAIFNQGEPADRCYFLCEGAVKVLHTLADGGEVMLDLAGAPSAVGKGEILQRSVYFFSVLTITETVELAHIKMEILIDLLKDYPAAMQILLNHLRGQTDKAYKLLACMKLRVRDRLLCLIVLNLPLNSEGEVSVPFSNMELAQLAQTTPETISRTIRQLQAEGKVDVAGGIFKIKKGVLQKYLDQLS